MARERSELLTGLLQQVSRSFYLTLRLLPGAIRPQIGLAYLLARTTDTIADTAIVSVEQRLEALGALRTAILDAHGGDKRPPLREHFGELSRQQGLPAERELLQRIDEALASLVSLAPGDRQRIGEVLATITSGQVLDLRRFGAADAQNIVALSADDELDDYTYRVAGCVGEFWTKMCRAHLFPDAPVDDAVLLSRGVRFGQGLQLVNILRDLPRDLRQGRCYIPNEALVQSGLAPADLLRAENEPRFRPLYDRWLDRAHGHLAAGWEYTNALPRGTQRVRLACALPILIGVKTLRMLRRENVLEAGRRLKVSRGQVRGIVGRMLVRTPFRQAWLNLFQWADHD